MKVYPKDSETPTNLASCAMADMNIPVCHGTAKTHVFGLGWFVSRQAFILPLYFIDAYHQDICLWALQSISSNLWKMAQKCLMSRPRRSINPAWWGVHQRRRLPILWRALRFFSIGSPNSDRAFLWFRFSILNHLRKSSLLLCKRTRLIVIQRPQKRVAKPTYMRTFACNLSLCKLFMVRWYCIANAILQQLGFGTMIVWSESSGYIDGNQSSLRHYSRLFDVVW